MKEVLFQSIPHIHLFNKNTGFSSSVKVFTKQHCKDRAKVHFEISSPGSEVFRHKDITEVVAGEVE